jgi:hypothetical protein
MSMSRPLEPELGRPEREEPDTSPAGDHADPPDDPPAGDDLPFRTPDPRETGRD